jgi:predicted N-acetyltransferase YhbS
VHAVKSVRLAPLDAQAYAHEILPMTAGLWARGRTLATYAAQTLEIARTGYGKRHYRLIGCFDGEALVSSCRRHERVLHFGANRLRAIGIAAVFTPPGLRGRGYASAMIGMLLDSARAQGYDLAYLFSDIRPHYYEELGFRELPSRQFSIRADTLGSRRIEVSRIGERDWSGVRRCFEITECARPWGFVRTPLVWEWIRIRMRHASEHENGQQTNLVVRQGRAIVAYVFGVRAPQHDAFILDELGFAGPEVAPLAPSLLRSAAGDLQRITGWLPPDFARGALTRASIRKRRNAIFMAAPLTRLASRWIEIAADPKNGDGVWTTDHI